MKVFQTAQYQLLLVTDKAVKKMDLFPLQTCLDHKIVGKQRAK